MKLAELAFACYIYTHMTGYDSAYRQLLQETSPQLDLGLDAHQLAILKWLNKWGCRQFAEAHHSIAAREIGNWHQEFGARFFPVAKPIVSLSDDDFALVTRAYDNLASRTASLKGGREIRHRVGPTGAAKILFALRPNALTPWDDAIREHLGLDGSASSYWPSRNRPCPAAGVSPTLTV
jgi:hypothetical protein